MGSLAIGLPNPLAGAALLKIATEKIVADLSENLLRHLAPSTGKYWWVQRIIIWDENQTGDVNPGPECLGGESH